VNEYPVYKQNLMVFPSEGFSGLFVDGHGGRDEKIDENERIIPDFLPTHHQ
jgi:hypothetical protein